MYNPPVELRRISSRLTFVTKFLSPVFTLFVLWRMVGFGIDFPFKRELPFLGFFLIFLAAAVGYNIWTAIRIKSVQADANNLYVSNYFKETIIPLDHIDKVTEVVWLEPRVVTIHLKGVSEFGQKIAFLAPYRMFAFYSESPIVAELKRMAMSKYGN